MTSVKGCLADPFIHVLYGQGHQNVILGFGYNNKAYGFALGADNIWNFTNERYLRIGIVYGFLHGKTDFFGSASGLGKSAKHDVHTVELFAAYESFNEKLLKTNLCIILVYSHTLHRMHRVDLNSCDFNANMHSNTMFAHVDFVKNLFTRKGYNFGLWLRGTFYHVDQQGYDESSVATTGPQHVSGTKHDILTTVLGINVEKEFLDHGRDDRKFTLSLKSGWECHAIRKYSDTTATFDNDVGVGEFIPVFGCPSKHAAIIALEAIKKLNDHWSIVAFYVARVNKDMHTHTISSGIEYSF
jgi:outer membrane autotransporter protein